MCYCFVACVCVVHVVKCVLAFRRFRRAFANFAKFDFILVVLFRRVFGCKFVGTELLRLCRGSEVSEQPRSRYARIRLMMLRV